MLYPGRSQGGQFYLFYGKNKAILDGLVHGLIVNCVLPVREHGFESMAIYMNNVDYYQPDKSVILSPEKIAIAAKCAGIEPKIVFKNLFIQMAYNQQHQLAVLVKHQTRLKDRDISACATCDGSFFKGEDVVRSEDII